MYLQIKCERLFDFHENSIPDVAQSLEWLIDQVTLGDPDNAVDNFLDHNYDYNKSDGGEKEAAGKLITLLGGEKNVKLFVNTVEQIYQLAYRYGYDFDLHPGNFMLSSDGDIVINDPFSVGDFRHY